MPARKILLPLVIGLLPPLLFAGIAPDPAGLIPQTHRSDKELYLLADVDGNSATNEFVIVERATGSAYVYRLASIKSTYTNLTWGNAFNAGVSPVADAAILHDFANGPSLATASPDHHLITLTTKLDQASSGLAISTSHQSFFALPDAIAAIAPPDGGITANREDLLIISSTVPEGVGILNAATSPPQSLYLDPEFSTTGVRNLQPIVLNGSTGLTLGIGQPGGQTSLVLLRAANAAEKAPLQLISSTPVATSTTDFTFYPSTLPDKKFDVFTYHRGDKAINIYRLDGGGIGQIDTYEAANAIAFVQALESPDGYRLFVAYQSGKADVLDYAGGAWNHLYAMTPLSSTAWLAVLPGRDGSFHALHGANGLATNFELTGYGGGSYYHQASGTLNRSGLAAGWRDSIQAVAYTENPFVGTPVPVQTYKHGDWSSYAFSNLSLASLQYTNAVNGLDNLGAKTVGTLPTGAKLAVNQHQADIGFWFGSGSIGSQGPIVQIDPVSSAGLTEAIQPVVTALPGGTVFYRLGQEGAFSSAASGMPTLTADTVLEAYAVQGSLKGPIARATYSFDQASSSRDSDGDGLPDALEMDIGSDPLNGDTDGDGSTDLADLLSGGQAAVKNAAAKASEAAKQRATGGYGSINATVSGQAALPMRETNINEAADPAKGFESVIDAFLSRNNAGHRLNAPLGATSGMVSVYDATGSVLAQTGLTAATASMSQVAITDPRQFLVASTGPFSIIPEERPWRSDFESSHDGWQVIASGLKTPAPRAARPDDASAFAARVHKASTDSRKLVYDASQSPLQWHGNYQKIPADLSVLRSLDQRLAGRVRGILCEVYSLDTLNDGQLHVVLSNGSTAFVSDGQFLPKFDSSRISVASEAFWKSFLFEIDPRRFALAYTSTPGITLEQFLGTITEVAFIVSDDGNGVGYVTSSSYKGSTSHAGFAIDRIRAVGMPAGGYPMVAIADIPDLSGRIPAYERTGSTTVATALSAWLTDFLAASTIAPVATDLSVESTVVAILLEQALNGALYRQDPTNHANARQLAIFHDALGNPPEVQQLTADDLAFIRYPSRSVALPVVADAWESQDLLASIALSVAKNRLEQNALSLVAHALYRIAATFTGMAPEVYDQPLQALYSFLNLNGLEASWTDALATLNITPDTLAAALDEADAIVTGALNSNERDMEVALRLTLGTDGTSLTDTLANTWELLDRDGDRFLFPDQFAFPDGSVIQVAGYTLPDGPVHKRLEVTELILVSLPRTTPQDRDGNLIDDRWELLFFGTTGLDPYADPDLDGYNNLSEFINGTDPNIQLIVDKNDDPADLPPTVNWPAPLRIERQSNGDFWVILPMPQSQAAQFSWTIEVSNDLQAFSSDSSIQESNGTSEQIFVIPAASFNKAFFRLKAELQ